MRIEGGWRGEFGGKIMNLINIFFVSISIINELYCLLFVHIKNDEITYIKFIHQIISRALLLVSCVKVNTTCGPNCPRRLQTMFYCFRQLLWAAFSRARAHFKLRVGNRVSFFMNSKQQRKFHSFFLPPKIAILTHEKLNTEWEEEGNVYESISAVWWVHFFNAIANEFL